MAKLFTAGRAAYLAALAAPGERELEMALARNIFAGAEAGHSHGAVRLARYARTALRQFEGQEEGALLRGDVVFPEPEAIADA